MQWLILTLLFCPLLKANDITKIAPADFVKLMRTSIFSENRVAQRFYEKKGPLTCTMITRHLLPTEAQDACFDCTRDVHLSLKAQGYDPANFKEVGFSEPVLPGKGDLFIGSNVPGHLFTLVRLKTTDNQTVFVAIDPTLNQFAAEPFYDFLKKISIGQGMLQELRAFGFWVVTPERYRFLHQTFKKTGGRLVKEVPFEKLEEHFNGLPQVEWKTRLDYPKDISQDSFFQFHRSLDGKQIEKRIKTFNKDIPFPAIQGVDDNAQSNRLIWPTPPK